MENTRLRRLAAYSRRRFLYVISLCLWIVFICSLYAGWQTRQSEEFSQQIDPFYLRPGRPGHPPEHSGRLVGEGDYQHLIGTGKLGQGQRQGQTKHLLSADEQSDHSTQNVPKPTKVLLVTYMRGGSSVLGELFNRNPDAFYWFEPFDGLYSHLYGVDKGWIPLQVLMTTNGSARSVPAYEREAMVQTLKSIYDCDTDNLPLDVLTNYNFLTLVQNKVTPYAECMRYGNDRPNGTLSNRLRDGVNLVLEHIIRKPAYRCKGMLARYCSVFSTAESNTTQRCHKTLHPGLEGVEGAANFSHIPVDLVKTYRRCMSESYNSSQPCYHLLRSQCLPTKMRAVKAIRLNLDLLPDIMAAIPDIKIIVYHRDPRAIVVSRHQTRLLSPFAQGSMFSEARAVCERMLYNQRHLEQAKQKYGHNIMELKYEDLATRPLDTARLLYEFLGAPLPVEVQGWIKENFQAVQDSGWFGTTRRNATDTAHKWRRLTPTKITRKMTFFCMDALQKLHYQL